MADAIIADWGGDLCATMIELVSVVRHLVEQNAALQKENRAIVRKLRGPLGG